MFLLVRGLGPIKLAKLGRPKLPQFGCCWFFLGIETQIVLVEFTVSGKLERRRWKSFKCADARISGERNAEARGKKVLNMQGNGRTA